MRRYLPSFLLVFGVFVLFTLAGTLCTLSAWAAGREAYAAWDTLARAFHEVESRYVEELGDTELVYAALEGLVDALDPHSAFLDPQAYRELLEDERDRYFGIGTRLGPDPEGLRVLEVLPDSPAERGGILANDLIVAIDGHPIADDPFEQATARIQGPRGAEIALTIQRAEVSLDFSLARDLVHVPAVYGELLSPGRAYISLNHFQRGGADELSATLQELQRDNGAPLRELILDLRDNPGGLLSEAVAVTDLFVGDVPIVSTRGRDSRGDESFRGRSSAQDLDIDPIILINGGSASASEIVAGSLQALGRATLVGTASYGKGSVQGIWAFEDESALKLTISKYHLSNDEPIDPQRGLSPDHVVRSQGEEHMAALLQRFVAMAREDENLRTVDRAHLIALLEDVDTTLPNPERRVPWQLPVSERLAGDPQLAKALDLLSP